VYLIGGTIGLDDVTAFPIEIWSINEDDGSVSFVQTMPEPILDNWWDNPMAFFVNPDICEQFCIRATSTDQAPCDNYVIPGSWNTGDPVEILHNGNLVTTVPHAFTEFNYCFTTPVDEENDTIQFRITGDDGVCFASLRVNNVDITGHGSNQNLDHFWFDTDPTECTEDRMITPQVTIQNARVISSICGSPA
jgi:hypothetical protein